jgi:hypothetical protein
MNVFQQPGHIFAKDLPGLENIAGQVFHTLFLRRLNSGPAKDIEPGMAPAHEHPDEVLCELSFIEKPLEDFVPIDLFQMLCVEPGYYAKHAFELLSPKAKKTIKNTPTDQGAIASISIWEFAIMASRGKSILKLVPNNG